jgi:hypothetical protein
MTKKTDVELRADNCRQAVQTLFGLTACKRRYRVSVPSEPEWPELEIPANSREQARARYDAACCGRVGLAEHRIDEIETVKVELLETPAGEHQRNGGRGKGKAGSGKAPA